MKKRRPRRTFRTHRHQPVSCPLCGYEMEGSTNLSDERPPVPGDFTLCLRCGEILRFGPDLAELVPALGFEVFDELDAPNRRQLLLAQQAIRKNRFIQRLERRS